LISPIGLLAGTAMIADAENIKTNFDRKAMQSQTVSTGQSASGFLFFKIPPGNRPRQWRLRARLRDIHDDLVGLVEAVITNPAS
jgi:hypothetical protein